MVKDAVWCHFDEGDLPDEIRVRFVNGEIVVAN